MLYPAWGRLDAALEQMSPQCYESDGTNQHETLFEDPQRLRDFLAGMHAITYESAAGVSDRVSTQAGNFWEDVLPAGADGYALGFILHDWDDGGGDRILDKIALASRRGAMLVVGEHLLAEDRTAPLFAVRQNLNMLVSARGRERSESEYRDWIGRHGFALRRTYPAPYGKHYMIAERL